MEGVSKGSKRSSQHLADEVMAVRLREADTLCELKEMKQKVMELETEVRQSIPIDLIIIVELLVMHTAPPLYSKVSST